MFGQVGCLAGRTIAYRRTAFAPAVERLVRPDRARRAPARRRRSRAHERAPAQRLAHRLPVDRARRDRRAVGLADVLAPAAALGPLEPARDAAQPALAVAQAGGVRAASRPTSSRRSRSTRSLALARRPRAPRRRRRRRACRSRSSCRSATSGCWPASGCARSRDLRRAPRDVARLPLFVLQITFVMVPIRIAAFATMFHQGWTSRVRSVELSPVRASLLRPEHPGRDRCWPCRESQDHDPGHPVPARRRPPGRTSAASSSCASCSVASAPEAPAAPRHVPLPRGTRAVGQPSALDRRHLRRPPAPPSRARAVEGPLKDKRPA